MLIKQKQTLGNSMQNVAYYKGYKYNSIQRLQDYGKMHGVQRVVVFCLMTAVLPTILIITPLYLRHVVYANTAHYVAESDILKMSEGISSVFCQRHTLRMNHTFNAFQVNRMPEYSRKRKHIRLKKSMTLPDDTLEYWGFFLLKGATVKLKVCSRYEGARILVVRGTKNLTTCGLLEHNLKKFGAQMDKDYRQVQVTFESHAQEIVDSEHAPVESGSRTGEGEGDENTGGEVFGDETGGKVAKRSEVGLGEDRSGKKLGSDGGMSGKKGGLDEQKSGGKVGLDEGGKVGLDEETSGGNVGLDGKSPNVSGSPAIAVKNDTSGSVSGDNATQESSIKNDSSLEVSDSRFSDSVSGRENASENAIFKSATTTTTNVTFDSTSGDASRSKNATYDSTSGDATVRNDSWPETAADAREIQTHRKRHTRRKFLQLQTELYKLHSSLRSGEDIDLKVTKRAKRSELTPIYNGAIEHGGNAVNFNLTTVDGDSSASSFESGLLKCYDGNILLTREFPPSDRCNATDFFKRFAHISHDSHLDLAHEIISDGYYYYIFYSDNDLIVNDFHAVFDIYKPTFKYANISTEKICVNKTECAFDVGFFSNEDVFIEVLTRDGLEHDGDDISLLVSVCEPRTSVYILFPFAVMFLILGCAFL